MELEVVKKLIKKYLPGHGDFLQKAMIAKRYYEAQNDILFMEKKKNDEAENPMRNADNRIAMTFYPLLVDQKISYLFTAPPLFDTKNDAANQLITEVLGGEYAAKVQEPMRLIVVSGGCITGWMRIMISSMAWYHQNRLFRYGPRSYPINYWRYSVYTRSLMITEILMMCMSSGMMRPVPRTENEGATNYRC